MNEQVLIDKAWDHLATTRQKSMFLNEHSYNQCCYGSSGCAFRPAIHLLFDDIEGESAANLVKKAPEHLKDWARFLDPDFADKVQSAHDWAAAEEGEKFLIDLVRRLHPIIRDYNLKMPATMLPYLRLLQSPD